MRAKSKKVESSNTKAKEKFISGAKYSELNDDSCLYEWENPELDKSKIRKMTIRIPEEYALKLEFLINERSLKTTKQRLILENLTQFIDKEINKRI